MTKPNYSPSPWKADGDYIIACGLNIGWTKFDHKADQTLAIAAPDMYEALINLIALASPHFTDSTQMLALSLARAAIAKAEGRS